MSKVLLEGTTVWQSTACKKRIQRHLDVNQIHSERPLMQQPIRTTVDENKKKKKKEENIGYYDDYYYV